MTRQYGKQSVGRPRPQPAAGEFTARVNPDDLTTKACTCGCEVFIQAVRVATLPATHPQNAVGKEAAVTMPALICASCKTPL